MGDADVNALAKTQAWPSVTLLFTPRRDLPGNAADRLRLGGMIEAVSRRLDAAFGEATASALNERLEGAVEEIDLLHPIGGLAVFVAPSATHVFQLPAPVRELATVDDGFALRDALAAIQRHPRFRVLALSERESRLFESSAGAVLEVHKGFPQMVEYPREEDTPHRDLPVHESEDAEARLFEFRAVDGALAEIDKEDPLPLVVTGVERDLSAFREASRHSLTIAGEVTGNHVTTAADDLAVLAEPVMAEWLRAREREIVSEALETVSAHKCVVGLEAALNAAPEARIHLLLVEQDLRVPAATTEDLTTPAGDGVTAPDVVDRVVREVLKHRGDVIVTSPDSLAEQGRVAALLRY